ncbi:NAD(P)-dependent steroid dehydrogenase [Guillardia theta CCMP2712]|uniref:NAD(P)-dependent steroid dehydrogenase n=1 Tax=Guillardia theta (strain CCMP2712) TaxID=905079 RepID=L1I9Y6_GUITC|nr:NAD(P)-dependent steroid dehydrogenase [Guillardia theta CCMP2712]EKX32897.1 NAD(P)-dependent steroid dehydrogenase [Guillardia theta CCMP2712]|eukprot:XP_005819877.1 NAD(P)-dependent steroid dehydrogenase [Guillardia theta CCMP2712]
MLIERGAERVVSFDIVPAPSEAWKHPKIEWRVGDICDKEAVLDAVKGADCVWHNAAAVGPFHPKWLYMKVNYEGTLNVIEACKQAGVKKVVMSSSPSTRFTGVDVDGLTEAQLPPLPLKRYLQGYAETKAIGELAMRNACCDELMTIAVAPHQVYGPRDNLFLPNLLEAAGNNKLRIFGPGHNKTCFTHVDNYCHALIISERTLKKGSPTLGKFYIVTDGRTQPEGQHLIFWKVLDEAVTGMGFTSLWSKWHLPKWFLFLLAYLSEFVGMILNQKFKLNVFNVLVLTMHRWFDISAAEKDLSYQPIISFRQGWDETIWWFKQNWLPNFKRESSYTGIATNTQKKIDIQSRKHQVQR